MITPADMKRPIASSQPAAMLIRTPVNVRTFGWIRSLTQTAMISRSGRWTRPMAPVKVTVKVAPIGRLRM